MDEREARARGLIEAAPPRRRVKPDHLLVTPVMAVEEGGLKIDEITYTRPQGQSFKLFHPFDVSIERLLQMAERDTAERLAQQERERDEAENP